MRKEGRQTSRVIMFSNLSASQYLIEPSLPAVMNMCVSGMKATLNKNNKRERHARLPRKEHTRITESSCAKRLLWQSPKSRPQILTFLSAEPVTISVESVLTSIAITGSYNEKKISETIRRLVVQVGAYLVTVEG